MSRLPVIASPAIDQPAPFELTERDGLRVASNGGTTLMLLDDGGRIFRRRGVKGLTGKPTGEAILPQLNQLAGEILERPDMPSAELAGRLAAMATQSMPTEPQRIEWCVAELNGVKVYADGDNIIVTTRDLLP